MKHLIILSSLLVYTLQAFAQVSVNPSISPEFFAIDDEITITYDVSGTALVDLTDAYIWMWAPDASTDAPSNVNPASSNTAATDPAKLTKSVSGDQVSFSITLVPKDFLNSSDEAITRIGMLLKGNDWGDGQTVDYVVDLSEGFSLKVQSPSFNYGFYSTETSVDISAKTSESATISFFVDQVLIESIEGDEYASAHELIKDGEVHELVLSAKTGLDSAGYRHTYITETTSEEESAPAKMLDGINYLDDTSATLVLTAPGKESVFVIGDFNSWSLDKDFQMKKDGDQFWVTIQNLIPEKEYIYQYLVDGEIRIADPYAEKISSQFDDSEIIQNNKYPNLLPYPSAFTSEAASYLQTAKASYEWKTTDFQKPNKEDLIIYELLVRDFTEDRSYQAVIDKLDYLDSLGVNAIELMPVMEFEGNLSWGYNPSSMFAADKFYGTENDLRTLIDEAHAHGMAVIFDIVLNHAFGRNSLARLDNQGLYGQPNLSNSWLNPTAKHDFNVGYDFNHESEYTTAYSERIVKYWIEQYNIDGYRFDLSKGLTQKNTIGNVDLWGQLDNSRVEILKNIADHVWDADSEAYVILEHFGSNEEEKILSEYGMMLWGNMHGAFNNAAKGSPQSLGWLYHENRGWSETNLVGYFESHDEERLMWGINKELASESMALKLKKAQLSATFLLTVPGPKLIWQFGEFGYDLELNDDRVGVKPTRWEYLEDENRLKLFRTYQALTNLRTKTDYVDPDYFEWNTGASIKWINIDHPDVQICVVGNFGKESTTRNPNFLSTGTWYNYLTQEPYEISNLSDSITLASGDFLILTSSKIDNYISGETTILSNEQKQITQDLFIYPNPASDIINIHSDSKIIGYSIRSMSGVLITSRSDANISEIEVSKLKAGLYFIQLISQLGSKTVKFYKD